MNNINLKRKFDLSNNDFGPSMYSKAYHRYFEDTAEVMESRENGKGFRIKRVYVGETYTREESKSLCRIKKIYYSFSFVLSFLLLVKFGNIHLTSTFYKLVELPQSLILFFMLFYLIGLFNYLLAGRVLTKNEYKTGPVAVKRLSLITGFIFVLDTLALLSVEIYSRENFFSYLPSILGLLAAAFLCFSVWKSEKCCTYKIAMSNEEIPTNAELM